MVGFLLPPQFPVAPVPGGFLVGAVANYPLCVTGLVVTLRMPGKWSSTSYCGAGATPFLPAAGLSVPGFMQVRPPECCHARLRSLPLILVSE